MPSDSPSHSRRHFHRSRRGHDRRGTDRRNQSPSPQPAPEQAPRGDHVDVEQIMRDIRAKIAQRHGVELTDQQVQELAARRLESILDPRTLNPSLLEQLRRSAGARPESVAEADRASAPYEFEDTTLYDSPSAFTRFIRKLLNPILKLFFNPNPLIRALHIQSRLNAEAARREAQRDQRQAEWNALHYELLHRVVMETSKLTLEVQSLSLKMESLAAKVDFNERRVRGIEGLAFQARSGGGRDRDAAREPVREREAPREPVAAPPSAPSAPSAEQPAASVAPAEGAPGEAPRRRRRRRRGRRGGGGLEMPAAAVAEMPGAPEAVEGDDLDEGEADALDAIDSPDVVTTGTDAIPQIDDIVSASPGAPVTSFDDAPRVVEAAPVVDAAPAAEATPGDEAARVEAPPSEEAPERVTPQLATPAPEAREEAAPGVPAPPPPPEGDTR